MERQMRTAEIGIATIVAVHLIVCLVHGAAHSGADVPLSLAGTVFVWLIILAGPPAGLVIWRTISSRAGAWIVAATFTASLVFGLINHFVLSGTDHVMHVAAPWRMLFGVTAVLLVVTEGFGSAAAAWAIVHTRRAS
jgi:hypothetical protein